MASLTASRSRAALLVCSVLLLLLLLLAVVARPAQAVSAGNSARGESLSAHVLNMTLAGATNGWPETTEALAALTTAATSTICGGLPSDVSACKAFLMSVSTGVVGLQVSVQTQTAADSSATYRTLLSWSNNVNAPLEALRANCAQALGVPALDPLTFRSGQYLMPCRTAEVYEFLPECQSGEAPVTVVYVGNASGTINLQTYFTNKICSGVADCSGVSVTVSSLPSQSDYSVVNITGAASGLEAVLSYVADVRAHYVQSLLRLNPGMIPLPGPGNADAGVSATLVQMRHDGMEATLFSTSENNRYDRSYPITPNCPASTGLWALALLALLPILMFSYLWIRHRGRTRAKKRQRKLIIEDERRIMQGYADTDGAGDGGAAFNNTAGYYADDGAADPPPGTEYQRMFSQGAQTADDGTGGGTVWMMDADGNYYEVPANQYQVDNANEENAQEQGMQNEATGEQNADPNSADGANDSSAVQMQTYVDPNTGEVYQYEYDPAAAGDATQGAEAGGGAETQFDTYIDPTTGEAYQHDPNAAQEDGEGDEGASGLQTYVDPNTGEEYQYDPKAEAKEG